MLLLRLKSHQNWNSFEKKYDFFINVSGESKVDLFLGRITCTNITQANDIVNKKKSANKVFADLKYFFYKHAEADINLLAINDPFYDIENIFYEK